MRALRVGASYHVTAGVFRPMLPPIKYAAQSIDSVLKLLDGQRVALWRDVQNHPGGCYCLGVALRDYPRCSGTLDPGVVFTGWRAPRH